jgi:hypothetical protein
MRKQIPLLAATSRALAMLEAVIEDGGASSVSALAASMTCLSRPRTDKSQRWFPKGFLPPPAAGATSRAPACAPFSRVSMTSSW